MQPVPSVKSKNHKWLDDPGVEKLIKKCLGETYYRSLKAETDLLTRSLTVPCSKLLSRVSDAPPSPIVLRKIIRASTLGDEIFDTIVYADLNFTEIILTHFLNLITSRRNPLTRRTLERTAATFTTVAIVNNLFLSSNDVIDLTWFEKEIQVTGCTKWDGVAFVIKNQRVTPVLVEFSGGFNANSTPKKKTTKLGW
ncbi:hypothetical protein DFQ28_009507 [Apophysomyces sp. BC1034]|nr:hypothetical protein DFQ30_009191 [Apophysomyces sp. BC1015]KAG0172798.1 hypothetical protein DFQ29_008222 [Apophysomyces sp. BC1021]KAG0185342.1 hypothetical protein DFQ28_009507 [Apophysomyces sp. BC1034]